eukprot:scaffold2644_cov129-Cylindrotheca_fusiformis.AAC.1
MYLFPVIRVVVTQIHEEGCPPTAMILLVTMPLFKSSELHFVLCNEMYNILKTITNTLAVFHDARHVETVYTDPANPSDTATGNVIVYNNADLLNAGDMGTVQGSVQGTCTIVSTTSASHYCSLSYQIFDGDSASVSFAAEGRVNNNDITGSTLTISGGFNGIEKFAGTAVLTPAYLDESIDPPLAVPDGRVFDGYLIKFQVQSNYAVVSTRTRSPSPAPSGV